MLEEFHQECVVRLQEELKKKNYETKLFNKALEPVQSGAGHPITKLRRSELYGNTPKDRVSGYRTQAFDNTHSGLELGNPFGGRTQGLKVAARTTKDVKKSVFLPLDEEGFAELD
jgi:hypothetical protein